MRETSKAQLHYERSGVINGYSNNNIGFFHWLRHPYKGLPYLLCSILFMLVALFFLFHYYLSNYNFSLDGSKLSSRDVLMAAGEIRKLERFGDSQSQTEILLRIDELKNIKSSVNKELLVLEKRRQQLLTEIGNYTVSIESLKLAYKNEMLEGKKIALKLNNLKIEFEEMKRNNQPFLEAPMQLLPLSPLNRNTKLNNDYNNLDENEFGIKFSSCKMSTCFDFSRCSIFSQFPVFVYNNSYASTKSVNYIVKVQNSAFKNQYVTENPNIACMFVVFGDELIANERNHLIYWGDSGRNHLIINTNNNHESNYRIVPASLNEAIFAHASFRISTYRPGFDVILPCLECVSALESLHPLPMMVPVKRKHLMTFLGDVSAYMTGEAAEDDNIDTRGMNLVDGKNDQKPSFSVLNKILKTLNTMQDKFSSDNFLFKFFCKEPQSPVTSSTSEDFPLCGSQVDRLSMLEQSTFSLILSADHITGKLDYSVSTIEFQMRLVEALRSGAVPVVIGVKGELLLPLEDIIDWNGVILWVPSPRITELHFVIRSFVDEDILEMRRRGRLIYETYVASSALVMESLFSSLRSRLQIPPLPIKGTPSENYFNATFPVFEQLPSELPENEEVLGPIEPPLDSPTFQRNFTSEFLKLRPSQHFETFTLFPHTPFRPILSGDAKYLGSSYGFRPIGDGLGGSGKEFAEALGGDYQREQFTIVVLTYEREAVLINAVAQFKGLPHLNKVIIIWNSDKPPSSDLRWPDIGVKIEAIKMPKNSLNNRFLPFDTIKTEAVLSIDDDVHLRHDEIIFAFRVWRQSRDRIVGFPGRFVSFYKDSNQFYYNSNYTCEMSMVLTGAAFLHKYYLYVYSYIMPQVIRDKVDEFLNCEDIAMNFLVSHIARKPPIKVTSRWTFKCPNCPNTLYSEDSHFDERHQCITFFTQIYGYLPLLTTQYRADSILFKTRIPHDKQKCFRYI